MALTYEQQKDISRMGAQAGRSILEKTIIYGAELVKFIANFIGDMVKQVIGK